jgi:hypothetical protein|tara:strand:+ start:391 stop:687 length:297 start_codon:yes stop_codon:yes gene_type:complete
MQMISKNKMKKIFQDFNNEILEELIPNDMVVPKQRMQFSMMNLSWLCRNLQIKNKNHPEIKQTMSKLSMLRNKILLGQAKEVDKKMNDEINKMEMRFG